MTAEVEAEAMTQQRRQRKRLQRQQQMGREAQMVRMDKERGEEMRMGLVRCREMGEGVRR